MIAITKGKVDSRRIDQILFQAAKVLGESTGEDYLILTGPPTVNFVVAAVWITLHGQCNLLVWDAFRSSYLVRTLDVPQIDHVLMRAAEGGDHE